MKTWNRRFGRGWFMRAVLGALLATAATMANAESQTLRFGVLNQRSPQLTASYWNPILEYIGRRAGVTLVLGMGKTAPETTAMTLRGDFDFAFTNHLFTPDRDKLGWQVIARPKGDPIIGEVVVMSDSPHRTLASIKGQEVAFPSQEAFVGYQVPMDKLNKDAIQIKPIFAGNQEGAMGQLRAGVVAAAGVNSKVMARFAEREKISYRVLWRSENFLDIPIMAHPRVPKKTVEAVRAALINMANDPEGMTVLKEVAEIIKQSPPYGFIAAENRDYDNYRQFFRDSSL